MFKEIGRQFDYVAFNRAKQQAFLEDLSSLIADGVSVQQAVVTIQEFSKGVEEKVAKSILTALSEGKYMAEGMENWFPLHIIAIVRSGEEGGTLADTMHAAAEALSQSVSVASSLLSSLAYPFVVLVLACVVAIFLKHSIFSNFATIKPADQWPEIGKTFMYFATIAELWWWAVIIGVVGFIYLLLQFFHLYIGNVRKFLDTFPPFSIYRAFVAAQFMEVLGLLVSNGISFKDALTIAQRKSNRYLIWHVYMMQMYLGGGKENIAEVLDTGLIDAQDIARLKVIAKGKGFEHALTRLGEQATRKNTKQMQTLGKILGGLLLALDAGLAMFMILSVYNVGTFIGGAG
jgi:type II secretory pathway component PulF